MAQEGSAAHATRTRRGRRCSRYKGPRRDARRRRRRARRGSSTYKIREEREVRVADAEELAGSCEALGLRAVVPL